MSIVAVTNIQLARDALNPAPFGSPIEFLVDIQVQSTLPEEEDLMWKVAYVTDAEDSTRDQLLAETYVGPVKQGRQRIPLTAKAPDTARIHAHEALGVTLLLITGSYTGAEHDEDKQKDGSAGDGKPPSEFIRIGYYINNEYSLERPDLRENPPSVPQWEHITRHILLARPRITRFRINWGKGLRTSAPSTNVAKALPTGGFGAVIKSDVLTSSGDAPQSAAEASLQNRMTGHQTAPKKAVSKPLLELCETALTNADERSLGQHILSFLAFADIFAVASFGMVSKRAKALVDKSGWLSHYRNKTDDGNEVPKDAYNFLTAHIQVNGAGVAALDFEREDEAGFLNLETLSHFLDLTPNLEHLNVSWASSLNGQTQQLFDLVDQKANARLSSLQMAVRDRNPPSSKFLQDVAAKPQNFLGRLTSLELANCGDQTLTILTSALNPGLLRKLSLPNGSFSQDSLLALLSRFPALQTLGVELCRGVSAELVSQLRSGSSSAFPGRALTVRATHAPRDFSVDLTLASGPNAVSEEVVTAIQKSGIVAPGQVVPSVTRVFVKPVEWFEVVGMKHVSTLLPPRCFAWPDGDEDAPTCGFVGTTEDAEKAFRLVNFTEVGEPDEFSYSDEDEEDASSGEEQEEEGQSAAQPDVVILDGSDSPKTGKRAAEDEPEGAQEPAAKRSKMEQP